MAKTKTKTGKRGKTFRIELTPLSALLWAVFIFFSLTWIFVLGILVGRGLLPGTVTKLVDLKAQMKRLQEMVGDKKAQPPGPQEEPDTAVKLDFFQELISKKDEVKKSWDKDTGDAETPEPPPVDTKEEKPGTNKKEDRVPFLPEGQYTVQLASLREMEQAEKMIQHLTDMGYDPYYYKASVEGKTYYRIRCGRFKARQEALHYAAKIENESGLKGFVAKVE